MKSKNPVAKFCKLFNRAKVIPDKKKDYCRKLKHKALENVF